MRISDVTYLLMEESVQKIKVYDLAAEEEVYSGTADELPSEFADEEICSIDPIENNTITFNIDTSEAY